MSSLRDRRRKAVWLLLLAAAGAVSPAAWAAEPTSDAFAQNFADPPASARPRVWWHWMNGNITKDGIAKDLAWMKRVGIGGAQTFDANLRTPQIVDKRLVYMTPDWKDAFHFAAAEADRLGLELAIASSPGWSETGGPWVPAADGLKKIVWSEIEITGGKPFKGALPRPPEVTGPFQSIAAAPGIGALLSDGPKPATPTPFFSDIAVLAVPIGPATEAAMPVATDGTGQALDVRSLTDDDLTSGVSLPVSPGRPPILQLRYAAPHTIRSARLFAPASAMQFFGPAYLPRLEASDNGHDWRTVANIPMAAVPTAVAFAPVTARQFRLVFDRTKTVGFSPAASVPGVDHIGLGAGMGAMGEPHPLTVSEFRLAETDQIDRVEAKAGFSIVEDYLALSPALPDAAGPTPSRVINITDRLRGDGTLDWTPPKGRWRVIRFGSSLIGTMNHPATAEATGPEVDKFDGAAVRRYLDHYLGLYKDAAGPDLIGAHGVRAILNDSIEVGAANWTPRMIEQFTRLRGYDPTPWLPALTGMIIGSRSQTDAFLYDYRRTLADLIASEHYGTVASFAHANGLKVYGEALEDHRPSLGDDMAMRSHADVPMAALWAYGRTEKPRPSYLADMKGAASVAHVYGQNLVAAESMTSFMSPWAYGPNDLKHMIDLEFLSGINRPVVHTSVHVPTDDKQPGLSLFVFGQYFNRNESWADLAKPWIDYIARNAFVLQQGRNVADIAYLYGEEGPLTALYGDKPVADAPTSVAYDFVNADALLTMLSNDGADLVTPGGARYRALYLGGASRAMTLPTLRRIAALVEAGATVIGAKPMANPSLAGDPAEFAALVARLWPDAGPPQTGKGKVIVARDSESALAAAGIAHDFRVTGGRADSDVRFVHRKLADGDSYFVSNRQNRAEAVDAHFRVIGKVPEL
jgi:hypothetical protein